MFEGNKSPLLRVPSACKSTTTDGDSEEANFFASYLPKSAAIWPLPLFMFIKSTTKITTKQIKTIKLVY